MKLITERSRILEAADNWERQYPNPDKSWRLRNVGEALRRLNLNVATADDLEKIIGNRSWTETPKCSECEAENVPVAQVGEEPDYETATAWLCENCVRKALELFKVV